MVVKGRPITSVKYRLPSYSSACGQTNPLYSAVSATAKLHVYIMQRHESFQLTCFKTKITALTGVQCWRRLVP